MLTQQPSPSGLRAGEPGSATMLSTWNHGMEANAAGFFALQQGGNAMDMIEAGARIVEADATGLSVGIGGLPDRDGTSPLMRAAWTTRATQDRCASCKAAPLSLARKVMEDTPHVMLAGAGAEQYARELGIDEVELAHRHLASCLGRMAQDFQLQARHQH